MMKLVHLVAAVITICSAVLPRLASADEIDSWPLMFRLEGDANARQFKSEGPGMTPIFHADILRNPAGLEQRFPWLLRIDCVEYCEHPFFSYREGLDFHPISLFTLDDSGNWLVLYSSAASALVLAIYAVDDDGVTKIFECAPKFPPSFDWDRRGPVITVDERGGTADPAKVVKYRWNGKRFVPSRPDGFCGPPK